MSITTKILKYGTYYFGYETQYCGKQYVAKKEYLTKSISKKLLKQERKLLVHLSHPCIVQQLVVLDNQKSPVILMERTYMSLSEFLTNKKSHHNKVSILHDVARGLQYIHERNIIHCDLTADSILLTEKITAKLADFGHAAFSQENIKYFPETLDHLPPEMFKPYSKISYSTKVDMFSFGCVIIHTLTQERPKPDFDKYTETSEIGRYRKHSEVERRSVCLEKFKNNCNSIKLHDIMLKCLQDHPYNRPTAVTLCSILEKLLVIGVPNCGMLKTILQLVWFHMFNKFTNIYMFQTGFIPVV